MSCPPENLAAATEEVAVDSATEDEEDEEIAAICKRRGPDFRAQVLAICERKAIAYSKAGIRSESWTPSNAEPLSQKELSTIKSKIASSKPTSKPKVASSKLPSKVVATKSKTKTKTKVASSKPKVASRPPSKVVATKSKSKTKVASKPKLATKSKGKTKVASKPKLAPGKSPKAFKTVSGKVVDKEGNNYFIEILAFGNGPVASLFLSANGTFKKVKVTKALQTAPNLVKKFVRKNGLVNLDSWKQALKAHK
jgi:exosome complex RNA-binding protein Csl4